ncbi:PorV/PorQ family protein [Arcticibacter eurypsychrophilus]|uniref:PorV/PorQ family protein n=1 Tax=Arcticibacter eurypsychrophilus TaxID=1434752 RepID=UPI00084DE623|nr:PorV/PorQ family protein [Arcticibacter eurypsychrophilus]
MSTSAANMKVLGYCRAILTLTSILGINFTIKAQESKQGNTQNILPFLLIAPDARSAGMGETGVGSSSDINSIHWNAAKYAFSVEPSGVSLSITPWNRDLAEDMSFVYVSGFKKLAHMQVIAGSIKYFNSGQFDFSDLQGNKTSSYKPYDLSIDFAYIKKLSEVISISTTFKYIRSMYTAYEYVQGGTGSISSIAADIGFLHQQPVRLFHNEGLLGLGINFSNIGPAIKYNLYSRPLPMNLRIGSAYTAYIDNSTELIVCFDINKLFADGISDKINYSAGIEALLAKTISLRTGFFKSDNHPTVGDYLTAGMGVSVSKYKIDISYLVSFQKLNPVNNTIHYTIGYFF